MHLNSDFNASTYVLIHNAGTARLQSYEPAVAPEGSTGCGFAFCADRSLCFLI